MVGEIRLFDSNKIFRKKITLDANNDLVVYDESGNLEVPPALASAVVEIPEWDPDHVYAWKPAGNWKGWKLIAKGEAGVDDTSVIQKTWDVGGKIAIKKGTYYITSLTVTKNGTEIHGEEGTKLVFVNSSNVINVKNVNDIKITGVAIDASKLVKDDKALYIEDSNNVYVEKIKIYKSGGFAIFVNAKSRDTYNIRISKCYLEGVGNNDVIGGGTTLGSKYILYDVIVDKNSILQGVGNIGNHTTCIAFTRVRRAIITKNLVYGKINLSAENSPNEWSIISSNICYKPLNNEQYYIGIHSGSGDYGCQYNIISNNVINEGFIDVFGSDTKYAIYNIVTDNIIRALDSPAGIYVKYASLTSITNNYIVAAPYGIYIDTASNNMITENHIIDSTNEAIYEVNSDLNWIARNKIKGGNIVTTGANTVVENNFGYSTENSGTATFSGDGSTTQFKIEHDLISTPSKVLVTPMTADAAGDFYVTADNTYIYINYKTAPPSGTENIKVSWYAEV